MNNHRYHQRKIDKLKINLEQQINLFKNNIKGKKSKKDSQGRKEVFWFNLKKD